MATRLRAVAAILGLALTAVISLGAEADSPAPDTAMYPGWKAVASSNWSVNTSAVKNWRLMLARWADGTACESDTCTTKGWAEMVAQVKAAGDPLSEVKLANSLINAPAQHPYIEDINNWNAQDYWETPYEFLKRSGDAEDFAITKYFLLRAAGLSADNMQIIAVRINSLGGIGHVILAVRLEGDTHTLILDNRVAAVIDAKLVEKEFKPALGINEKFWWVYLAPQ